MWEELREARVFTLYFSCSSLRIISALSLFPSYAHMDKLELDDIASNGETQFSRTTQCDNFVNKTRSSVLNNAHLCVSVCEKVTLLKVR